MMDSTIPRPAVKRTYGKVKRNSSSSSLSSAILFPHSSSPPPSSPLLAPRPSSPGILEPSIPSSPTLTRRSGVIDDINGEEEYDRFKRKAFITDRAPESDLEDIKPTLSTITSIAKHAVSSSTTQSTLRGFFQPLPNPRKRKIESAQPSLTSVDPNIPFSSSYTSAPIKPSTNRSPHKIETQLHLTHLPLLHTCPQCQMSFVRGGEDDGVHEKHHARVVHGIPLGNIVKRVKPVRTGLGEPSRSDAPGDSYDHHQFGQLQDGWKVIQDNVNFGGGGQGVGRVIRVDGSNKSTRLTEILQTVDTVLSSPALPASILSRCRIFLFVTSSPPPPPRTATSRLAQPASKRQKATLTKERVVAVVVSQRIRTAMRVLNDADDDGTIHARQVVDSGDGVLCELFTIPSYRGHGLAQVLLDAACWHTVYGCAFDPTRRQVAFSQPTQSGRAVMQKWGKGQVRVFVDDERQL